MDFSEKDSIYWFGLNKLAKDDMKLQYLITTEKEYIHSLSSVAFFGLHQYTLYRGQTLDTIDVESMSLIAEYIVEKYNELYKVSFKGLITKPKKIAFKNEDDIEKAKDILQKLILPYFNEYCFRTLNYWKNISRAYIAGMIINFEYDINHVSNDAKLKTSLVYPFLFTLNLINNHETQGLFSRVQKYYDRKKILRAYNSGREWKEKEINYLEETYSKLDSDEEWNIFLSNFTFERWDLFDIDERFKALFQLTKVTSILMKDEIESVTMLEDGSELRELLENYLPLFIFEDKVTDENGNVKSEFLDSYGKTLSPFPAIHINYAVLEEYIESKSDKHIKLNSDKLKLTCQILVSVLIKMRVLILTHQYLPSVIDGQISVKRKIFTSILKVFSTTEKEDHYKRNLEANDTNINQYFISEDEIAEMISLDGVSKPTYHAYNGFIKIGKIISYMIGVNQPTPKVFDYQFDELLKYVLSILSPHPTAITVLTQDNFDIILSLFKDFCHWYEKQDEEVKATLVDVMELPSRFLNFIPESK